MDSSIALTDCNPGSGGNRDPMTLVVARLESHGCDPRPTGKGYKARCPAHDDANPSLSISRGDDGRVLVRCFAGCSGDAVVESLELTWSDLFVPDGKAAPSKPTKQGKRTIHPTAEAAARAAAYKVKVDRNVEVSRPTLSDDYAEVDGTVVMRVLRFDPQGEKKAICPVSPHKGGWIVGEPDPKRLIPLFRLPNIVRCNGEFMFVVEGEPCVHALEKYMPFVTTSAFGAGKASKTNWSPLAGKLVVIVPDHDEPGETHVKSVLAELAKLDPRPIVRVVRLCDILPDRVDEIEEKDDIADWLPEIVGDRKGDDAVAHVRGLIRKVVSTIAPVELPTSTPTPERNGKHEEPSLDACLVTKHQTDLGNAERFVARHGRDLRYCHPWKKWLVWDGRRWKVDDTADVRRRARDTTRAILAEAAIEADDKRRAALARWSFASEANKRIQAMVQLAEAEEGVPVLPRELDVDPWTFNVANGTIDLRTGELRPHRREDMITKLCDAEFDPGAECPLWLSTLDLFFHREDPVDQADLIDYWQRVCGCAMAGVVRDHVLPIAYGDGSNGKSTMLVTLQEVFGDDYAMNGANELLMAKTSERHPTELADLHGKRLVVAIETAEARRLNESLIKQLTGGDRVRARRMREDFWQFKPTHTLIMATNHKPVIHGTDYGIWRRLKLIPFTVKLTDDQADATVPDRLKRELPGILAWCVRGCLEWQRRGLQPPKEVVDATAQYRDSQDVLGLFLAECTVSGPDYKVKASDLYETYEDWAKRNNEHVITQTRFGEALKERNYPKQKSSVWWYEGIRINPNINPEAY